MINGSWVTKPTVSVAGSPGGFAADIANCPSCGQDHSMVWLWPIAPNVYQGSCLGGGPNIVIEVRVL